MPASSSAAIIPLAPRRTQLAVHLEAFLTKLTVDGRSKHTISAYRRDLARVFDTLESLRPALTIADVTPGLLDQALAAPAIVNTARGQRSAASLHRLKAAVKAFFAWARDTGLVAEDPARGVRLKRLPRKPPSFLTQSEKRKLLKELKGRNTPADRRDRVIFELLLGTGIRLGELVGLDLEDVDLDAKHLRVRAKGNICQVKFLKTGLRSLLRGWLNERRRMAPDGERALFLSNRGTRITPRQVARRLDGWLARAGIGKRLSPHGLRHTFATHLYDGPRTCSWSSAPSRIASAGNMNPGNVCIPGRFAHKRAVFYYHSGALRGIATTGIYTHLVDGRLEEALERL